MKNNTHGSIRSYSMGFILSIILTLSAYIVVLMHKGSYHELLSHTFMIPLVVCIAVFQLFVQLIFFLHLGQESGPRWKLLFFISTVSIILLVVIGSMWIMDSLAYRMMPGEQVEKFIIQDEGYNR